MGAHTQKCLAKLGHSGSLQQLLRVQVIWARPILRVDASCAPQQTHTHAQSLFHFMCAALARWNERQREMPFSRATINSSHKMRTKQGAALSFFFAAFYERAKRQIIILELSFLSAHAYCNCALVFIRVPAAKFIYLGCNKIVLSSGWAAEGRAMRWSSRRRLLDIELFKQITRANIV